MKKRGMIPMALGLLLIVAALGLALYNQWDANRAGRESEQVLEVLTKVIEETTAEHQRDEEKWEEDKRKERIYRDHNDMMSEEIDGNDYLGVIEIPSLDLSLPVMKEWSYSNLTIAPCRYTGSYYNNDMVLCAHNYRTKHFYPIRWVDIGADVYFTTVNGTVYHYTVSNREMLRPTAVEEMVTAGDWDLTLFTCNADGLLRCTVRCVRAD